MELFGKFRVAVGGRTPGSDGSHRGVCSKTKETVDPVFWHSRPSLLYQEVMASYHLTALVDGGVADGVLAATACLKRVPYFGLALTQQHLEKVTERIVHVVMTQMLQTESGVFEPWQHSWARVGKTPKALASLSSGRAMASRKLQQPLAVERVARRPVKLFSTTSRQAVWSGSFFLEAYRSKTQQGRVRCNLVFGVVCLQFALRLFGGSVGSSESVGLKTSDWSDTLSETVLVVFCFYGFRSFWTKDSTDPISSLSNFPLDWAAEQKWVTSQAKADKSTDACAICGALESRNLHGARAGVALTPSAGATFAIICAPFVCGRDWWQGWPLAQIEPSHHWRWCR